jgi:hypothetical protein
MSVQVMETAETEAEALAEAIAGYDKTRGDVPPVDVVTTELPTAQEVVTPAIEEPAQLDITSLADELKALKAKVGASSGEPAEAVRRLHGEIGNINRTLKQLQAVKPVAPVNDELTAAMREAEQVAEEFPELAGPILKLLKTSMAGQTAQGPAIDIDQRVTTAVTEIRQREALEALTEEHPDWTTVRDTPEYKTWLDSKTPEFQERFNTTWNPAVVSKGLTEFKDSLKVRERKHNRLAAAVAPQGVAQKAQPSTLPDEAGFSVGYNKGNRKRQ